MQPSPRQSSGISDVAPMSKQQRRFSGELRSPLAVYREFMVGDRSWFHFAGFELYNLLLSNLPSIVGLGLRRFTLPLFLGAGGKKSTIGRGVSIRQPSQIALGTGAIIDDYAVLDVRSVDDRQGSIEIGNHALVGRYSIIAAKGGRIRLGHSCNISTHCRIATQSLVEIGESVLIAAYAYIGPGNHRFAAIDQPIIEQDMEIKGGVRIGARAWIGTRVTILDGVTIGEDAVIGAHSLVLEDVPARAVVTGVPAKIVRYRE